MSSVDMRVVEPDAEPARRLMSDYLDELGVRQAGSFDRARYVDVDPAEFEPPAGVLLIAYDDEQPVACGGVRVLAPGLAEIKRMYVAPSARGRGMGRTLLGALEAAAVELGCDRARLDTAASFTEAVALYRSAGYTDIAAYNSNPHATVWMERRLG
jgi:GNAT superfamily N-acetyltransferase